MGKEGGRRGEGVGKEGGRWQVVQEHKTASRDREAWAGRRNGDARFLSLSCPCMHTFLHTDKGNLVQPHYGHTWVINPRVMPELQC